MATEIRQQQFTVDKLLDGRFDRASYNRYWHFMMKTQTDKKAYQSSDVEVRIKQIIEKNRVNSFVLKSDGGMTPAHVAVLTGNKAGLDFLKSRDALAKDVKDDAKMTPLDYAKLYHPELLGFFSESFDEKKLAECLKGVFTKWKVELAKGPFTYKANTNDFGIELQSLLFAKPSDNSEEAKSLFDTEGLKIDYFAKNIAACGKKFGFEACFSNHQYSLRDHLVVLPNGMAVTFMDSINTQVALERSDSRALFTRSKAAFLTDHLIFKGSLGSAQLHKQKGRDDLVKLFGADHNAIPMLRFYFEGGDRYFVTNRQGEQILLIGDDIFFTSLNQMRRDGVFKDSELDLSNAFQFYMKQLASDRELLKQTLLEMYAQGLLKAEKGKEKGFIPREEIGQISYAYDTQRKLDGNEAYSIKGNPYLEEAMRRKFYFPLKLEENDFKKGLEIAANYLAQMEMTQAIIAKSFSVPFEHVVRVPQADYHLDVFIRPGPNGSLFIQDYSLCAEVLQEILANAQALQLTDHDQEMINRYLQTALKLDAELGPLLKVAKERLAEAGFTMVPAPGIFYDVSPDILNPSDPDSAVTFNLNFLNAVTGWSRKMNSYFYVATGAEVGDRLGEVLMRTFEIFIKNYKPNTSFEFIGFNPEKPSDFSEGMRWLNRRGSQLGPHCLSLEKKTLTIKINDSA